MDIEYENFTYTVDRERYWNVMVEKFAEYFGIPKEKAEDIIWTFSGHFSEEVEKYFKEEIKDYFEEEAYRLYKEKEDMESEEHYYATHEL